MNKHLSHQLFIFFFCMAGIFSSAFATDIHWDQGARRAWVLSIISTKHPEDAILPCLDSLTDDDIQNRHFVKVHYRHIRKFVTTIVEVPKDTEVKAGDEIEIIPEKCSEGKISTFFQVLQEK